MEKSKVKRTKGGRNENKIYKIIKCTAFLCCRREAVPNVRMSVDINHYMAVTRLEDQDNDKLESNLLK